MTRVWAMNARELTDKADSIAENAFLKLIGRLGMATALPVMIASGTWIGSTMWVMNSETAKLAGKLDVLTERLNAQMDDRYRGSDARRDFKAVEQKNEEQDRRLDRFDVRLDRIEASRGVQGPR